MGPGHFYETYWLKGSHARSEFQRLKPHGFESRQRAQAVANELSVKKSEQHRLVHHEGRWFLQNAVRHTLVTPEGDPLPKIG